MLDLFMNKKYILCLYFLLVLNVVYGSELTIKSDPMGGKVAQFKTSSLCLSVAPQIGSPLIFCGSNSKTNLLYQKGGWAVSYDILKAKIANKEKTFYLYDMTCKTDLGKDSRNNPVVIVSRKSKYKGTQVKIIHKTFLDPELDKAIFEVEISSNTPISSDYYLKTMCNIPKTIKIGSKAVRNMGKKEKGFLGTANEAILDYGKGTVVHVKSELGVQMRFSSRGYAIQVEIVSLKPCKSKSTTLRWSLGLGKKMLSSNKSLVLKKIERHNAIAPMKNMQASKKLPSVGINGYNCHDFPVLFSSAGIDYIRSLDLMWKYCQDGADKKVNLKKALKRVKLYKTYGLKTLALLTSMPAWASKDGDRRSPPKDYKKYGEYIEKLTRAFKGKIHAYEIWNEPDIPHFFKGTVDDYVKILKTSYIAAKKGDPNCYVLSAGLDGPGEAYLIEMFKRGAGNYCDAVSFHPYSTPPAMVKRRLKIVRNIMNYFKINKDIWITELGWQTGGWKTGHDIVASEEIKAKYLVETIKMLPKSIPSITLYSGREGKGLFGITVARYSFGFKLEPAYLAVKKLLSKHIPNKIIFSLPENIKISAGEKKIITIPLKGSISQINSSLVRVEGLRKEWYSTKIKINESDKSQYLELTLDIPSLQKTDEFDFVIGFGHDTKGLLGAAHSHIKIVNTGNFVDISFKRKWSIQVDKNKKKIGKWKPIKSREISPGQRVLQQMQIFNRGNIAQEFEITLGGAYTKWWSPVKKKIKIPANSNRCVHWILSVPEIAPAGPKNLKVKVKSVNEPAIFSEILVEFYINSKYHTTAY